MDEKTTSRMARTPANFNERVDAALLDLAELLKERHQHHGNAVFEPEGVFSTASPKERIHIMLDYKLARYRQGSSELRGENLDDMLGYLLLLKMME